MLNRTKSSLALLWLCSLAAAPCAVAGPGDWSGQGPFGGTINQLKADPTVPTRLYAATSNGFFRSDDAGTSWTVEETGMVVAHPTNGDFAVSGIASGGLWIFDDAGRLYSSSDAGNNWVPTGYVAAVAPLAYDGTNLAVGGAGKVWFAAGPAGLLVSADNGATFSAASGGFPVGKTATFVQTNPSNPQQVIAGESTDCVANKCSIYYSGNGGASWSLTSVSGTISATFGFSLTAAAFGPGNSVYALYGTIRGGSTLLSGTISASNIAWTLRAQTGSSLVASSTVANAVWVDDNKSSDGGVSFAPLATAGRTTNGVYVPLTSTLAVAADNAASHRLWIGTPYAGVYLSNDNGATWASSNDGMAASQIRSVVVHPSDNTRIFAGYGDALDDASPAFYRSTAAGTWAVSNSGLAAWQIRTVLIDPTTAGTIGSTVVYAVGSGGRFPNRNGGIYKSLDDGLTWSTMDASLPIQNSGHFAGFLRTIIADPRSCDARGPSAALCTTGPLQTLYATGGGVHKSPVSPALTVQPTHRVMKSTDGGVTWVSSENGLPPDVYTVDDGEDGVDGVTPIVMDPTNSNILYIGTFAEAFGPDSQGNPEITPHCASGVYKSVDGGANWMLSSVGLPTYTGSTSVLNTLSLAIDPANPQTLWVSTIDNAFSPASPGQIYKTTNGAASWFLSNLGVAGPDVRALVVDPNNPGTLYAASGGLGPANPGGVYKSVDGGANWMSISVGLPAYSATALTIDPIDPTVIYAGTNGGVYSIVQLPDDDADGVPDLIENSGPNGGDANGDSAQDSGQSNVGTTAPGLFGGYGWQSGVSNANQAAAMSILRGHMQDAAAAQASGIQGGYFTVQLNGGTCTQAVDVAPINPGPLGLDTQANHGTFTYPRGLLRFEVPQCAATVADISFNAATFGPGWTWRFYGPSTPGDNSTMGWHDAQSLVSAQTGTHWLINLTNGQFGSYRPATSNSILFEGGPSYNDTIFNNKFDQ